MMSATRETQFQPSLTRVLADQRRSTAWRQALSDRLAAERYGTRLAEDPADTLAERDALCWRRSRGLGGGKPPATSRSAVSGARIVARPSVPPRSAKARSLTPGSLSTRSSCSSRPLRPSCRWRCSGCSRGSTGVMLVGEATEPLGRRGIAIAADAASGSLPFADGVRFEAIFDRQTGTLLAKR
jgi:hypothetical protein